MRLLATLLIVCACGVHLSAAPPLYATVDDAIVDTGGGVTIVTVRGWAAGVGVDLTASIYINGAYMSSGIGQIRNDVCNAFHAQSLPCGMDLYKPCAVGVLVVSSNECVGLVRAYNISAWTPG